MNSTAEPRPQRRKHDRGWHKVWRENGYRDFWLLVITIFVLYAVIAGYQENGRRIDDICRATNNQNLAIRLFVRKSIPKDRLDTPQGRAYLMRLDRSFPINNC